MIKEITIGNFKSISSLKLELGRFNVLIGENGCGKTNILEAIAFAGAAAANKLDNEFLSSRGIRVTNPDFMKSAFDPERKNEINISVLNRDSVSTPFTLTHDNKPYSKWVKRAYEAIIKDEKRAQLISKFNKHLKETKAKALTLEEAFIESLQEGLNSIAADLMPDVVEEENSELRNFLIYSPENTSLRTFEQEGQILPLGIKGEGLFKLLKTLALAEDKKPVQEIKEYLKLIDWFDDFQLPEQSAPGEFKLQIKDRFLHSQWSYFDQRSSNEGFLFLLFYISLFVSEDTPSFFAIDNLEASFNPRLCSELSKTLAHLAQKRNKQVIVTTQNPSILDGINLHDDEQRLFVIKRNQMGHTIAKRITAKPQTKNPVKLSEAWTRGYIGGLPKNF